MKRNDLDAKNRDLSGLARDLNGILQDTEPSRPCWNESDYAGLLRHQLNASLANDLGTMFQDAPALVKQENGTTFGALLASANPSLPLLRMVRHFAKKLADRGDAYYPADLARVLYFSAIAAALVHSGSKITSLPIEDAQTGFQWALNCSWLTTDLKNLFKKASTP
jgi:hypothetical protein